MRRLLGYSDSLQRQNFYEFSVQRPAVNPVLHGTVQADVVVVGAGFACLSAAIDLAKRGYKVVVLEAQQICSGASGRNGGQVLVGVACGQQLLEKQLGQGDARKIWNMTLQAAQLVDARISEFEIECDRVHGALTVADSARKAKALQYEADWLQAHYGFAQERICASALPDYIAGKRYCVATYEKVSGHLHPLWYGLGLARAALALGVQIFEHSAVEQLLRGAALQAVTKHGTVRAAFGVLAGNCMLAEYGQRLAPEIAPRVMPVGTYMIATETLGPDLCRRLLPHNPAVCDNNFVLDYFRFSKDHRLLMGGQVSYSTRTPADLRKNMVQRAVSIFPDLKGVNAEFLWGGFVDISMNRAPDFGRLDHNLYYLQGFSGHGVALTGLAGQMVAQAIAGQAEQFDIFARLQHRHFPGGAALRTPTLVLGMLYHRMMDAFY